MKAISRRDILVMGGKVFFTSAILGGVVLPETASAIDWKRLFKGTPQGGSAKVQSLTGKATSNHKPIQQGDQVTSGSRVLVQEGGELVLSLEDGTTFKLKGKAALVLDLATKSGGVLKLLLGSLLAAVPTNRQNHYMIEGPTASIGIKGTVFFRQVFSEEERRGDKLVGKTKIPNGVLDYFCTCNGEVDYLDPNDKKFMQRVEAHHHASYYLSKKGDKVKAVPAGVMLSHTDQEVHSLIKEMPKSKHTDDWLVL